MLRIMAARCARPLTGTWPRAQILVNGVIVGRLDRNQEANLELGIAAPPAGPVQPENSSMAVLDILVEGYARRNTGTQFDVKGLPSTIVLLSGARAHPHRDVLDQAAAMQGWCMRGEETRCCIRLDPTPTASSALLRSSAPQACR